MPLAALWGAFFMLMGLTAGWMVIYSIRSAHSPAQRPGAEPRFPMSPAETWLWRIAWPMLALGFVSLGVTVLRHAKGPYMSVPPSAPLIYHVIWVLAGVGLFGGYAAFFGWAIVRNVRLNHTRREDSSRP